MNIKQKGGKITMTQDKKVGTFSIKSGVSQACDIRHSRVKSRRGQDQEEVDQDCARPRRSG